MKWCAAQVLVPQNSNFSEFQPHLRTVIRLCFSSDILLEVLICFSLMNPNRAYFPSRHLRNLNRWLLTSFSSSETVDAMATRLPLFSKSAEQPIGVSLLIRPVPKLDSHSHSLLISILRIPLVRKPLWTNLKNSRFWLSPTVYPKTTDI